MALYLFSLTDLNNKLSKLKDWLSPLDKIPACNIETLPGMIEQLKKEADDIIKMPRGLAILLRLIKHLAVAPANDYPEGEFSLEHFFQGGLG